MVAGVVAGRAAAGLVGGGGVGGRHLLAGRGLQALGGYPSTTSILHLPLHANTTTATHRTTTILRVTPRAANHRRRPIRNALVIIADLLSAGVERGGHAPAHSRLRRLLRASSYLLLGSRLVGDLLRGVGPLRAAGVTLLGEGGAGADACSALASGL